MLLMANHKPNSVRVRGILVKLEPGQLLAGEEFLAKRWKWSRGKVRRFMSELSSKTVQQIGQQKNNVCTVISITNWGRYQGNGTADSTTNGTTDGQQTDTPKNDKNGKNGKKGRVEAFIPPSFDEVAEYMYQLLDKKECEINGELISRETETFLAKWTNWDWRNNKGKGSRVKSWNKCVVTWVNYGIKFGTFREAVR